MRRGLRERRVRADERVATDWARLAVMLSPVRLWGRAVKGAVELASEAVALRGVLRTIEAIGEALFVGEKEREE